MKNAPLGFLVAILVGACGSSRPTATEVPSSQAAADEGAAWPGLFTEKRFELRRVRQTENTSDRNDDMSQMYPAEIELDRRVRCEQLVGRDGPWTWSRLACDAGKDALIPALHAVFVTDGARLWRAAGVKVEDRAGAERVAAGEPFLPQRLEPAEHQPDEGERWNRFQDESGAWCVHRMLPGWTTDASTICVHRTQGVTLVHHFETTGGGTIDDWFEADGHPSPVKPPG